MLARLFVFFGGLLVVALSAVLLAPFFVDWAGYRSAFEREASRIIGQPVRVEGNAKARILPFPSLTFSNVVIDGPDGLPAARIAAFSMDAELAPFLNGEILIYDMRIERPDVRLQLAENGALLWALPQSDVLIGKTIALENVNISEGRITVEQVGQAPLVFGNFNGKVSAQSLVGPWLAEGRFSQGATTYNARISTGAKEAGETLRARLSLAPQNGFYEAAFDGRIGLTNDAPSYTGKLELTALGIAQEEGGKRQKIADLKGNFAANANGIKITDASLTAGPADQPYRADGSLGLTFGEKARFDVTLKGQQISIGDIEGGTKGSRIALGAPLADRIAALQLALIQIPAPDIPGRVDLVLPALVIGDTIIRNTEIKAVPAKTGWQIERYFVELPGRTIVEGSGDLALSGASADALGFSGQMTLATKQPTGFANWLGLKANDAIRALPGAGFSARVDIGNKRQVFRDIEFRAGAAVLRGIIDRQVPEGARQQMSVQLKGENVDLDALSSMIGVASAQNPWLASQDTDIALISAPAFGFGFQAEKLEIATQYQSGVMIIEQADLTGVSGADIGLSGNISDVFLKPKGSVNVSISAIDPLRFIDALVDRFPDQNGMKTVASRIAFAGTAVADGKINAAVKFGDTGDTPQQALADYQFDAAGLRLNGTAQIYDFATSDVLLVAKGDADIGETVLAALGVPVGDTITALELLKPATFEVSLKIKAGEIQQGSLAAVSNTDSFETRFGAGAQPFSLTLADAAPFAMSAGYGLPGAIYGLPLNLKGFWETKGSTLTLQDLEGAFVDVPLSGALEIAQGERLKVTGNLAVKAFDRSAIDETGFGPLSAGGDDRAEFAGNISLPFDADILLMAEEGTGFLPLPVTKASARIVATKDAIRFADVKALFAGGQMTGAGELRKNGPEALIGFNAVVVDVDFSKIYKEAVTGQGALQIQLSATGSNLESLRSSTVGSGVLTAKNAVINGVNTSGFNSLVEEADSRDVVPDVIATLEMATRKLLSGQVALPEFQSAFTITSGVARASRNQLKIDGGILAVEPKIDLNSGEADIAAQLQFDIGTGALSGAEPALNLALTGPWNDLKLEIDVQSLQGFLGQRALEREEIRVEAIQSALIEKQRLRRENRYYAGLIEARAKAEADRLAEIERLAQEAAKTEQDRLEKERLDAQKRDADRLKALPGEQNGAPAQTPPTDPATSPADLPLNLDGLLKELEAVTPVQP